MKAFQILKWKTPAILKDVPVPEPGPGQILIKIGGAGVCRSDLHIMDHFEDGMVPFSPPFTLGHENAGWVQACGPGVNGLEIGQPVVVYGIWSCGQCRPCAEGQENYCDHYAELPSGGLGLDGGFTEYMLVPDKRFVIPLDKIEPWQAAPLTDAGLSSYHAVKRVLQALTPGSTVVVVGAGGLGHMAVQFLSILCGARIIAVDRDKTALQLAAKVGADLCLEAGEAATAEIRTQTGGLGVDAVLDFVGSDNTLQFAAGIVRSNGQIVMTGLDGGTLPFSMYSIPYGCSVSITYGGTRAEMLEVLALAEQGKIHAHAERYSLEEVANVYQMLRDGKIKGRAVITPHPK